MIVEKNIISLQNIVRKLASQFFKGGFSIRSTFLVFWTLCLGLTFFWASSAGAAEEHSLTLVKNGEPTASIVLCDTPTKAARLAAHELQAHVELITGAILPMVSENDNLPEGHVRIFVGDGKGAEAMGYTRDAFGNQEYVVCFEKNALVLFGRDAPDKGDFAYTRTIGRDNKEVYHIGTWPGFWDEKATLWAVYDFLERFCGVRWLGPTEFDTDYEPRNTLTVTGDIVRRKPSFQYRGVLNYVHSQNYDSFAGLWHKNSEGFKTYEAAAYPKLRADFPHEHTYQNTAKRGRHRAFLYRKRSGGEKFTANHSMYNFYNMFWRKSERYPEVFVEKRPEWFARNIEYATGGRYAGIPPQLCYTNPDVVDEVVRQARLWFDGKPINPRSGTLMKPEERNTFWGEKFFAVVPMDNSNQCQCENCKAFQRPREDGEGFARGTASELIWTFVNKVAKEVKKTHPDKFISALSYMDYAAYPETVELEDNIAVQICLGIRMPYSTDGRNREKALFEEWVDKEGNRPLYLWLYYCFPNERANKGDKAGWHVFPGFFAHTISDRFKRYHEAGARGMFFNGFADGADAYVTFALMEDVTQDVDMLLDEYFNRAYGPAGPSVRKLYEEIEEIYCSPENYPKPGHQTETIAWGFLGTQKRMKTMEALMDSARAAIPKASEVQQKRFELFTLRTWDYIVQGKEQYEKKMASWNRSPQMYCPRMLDLNAGGDPDKADWNDSVPLALWMSPYAEGSVRKIRGRMTHDGTYLYVELAEREIDPEILKAGETVSAGDHWQILAATDNGKKIREILVDPDGKWIARDVVPETYGRTDAIIEGVRVSSILDPEVKKWTLRAAIPISALLPDGVEPGTRFRFNVARRSPEHWDEPIWTPTFSRYADPERFARITLDTPEVIPTDVPDDETLAKLRMKELVGWWRFDEVKDGVAQDSSGNGNHGKIHRAAVPVVSPFGMALDFLFTSIPGQRGPSYVEVDGIPELKGAKEISLEAWIWHAEDPEYLPRLPSYPRIVATPGDIFDLHVRPGYALWSFLRSGDGKGTHYEARSRPFVPEEWEHVASVWDGERIRIYVNGRLAGESKSLDMTPGLMEGPMRIGLPMSDSSHLRWQGKIDEVAIYRRALNPGEIFARYQQGLKILRDAE